VKTAITFGAAAISFAALVATGCATQAGAGPAGLPAALAVPAGHVLQLEARASGVQIYDCEARPDAGAPGSWKFRAPEATLSDSSGRALGRHFAGPTWESVDGSSVVGQVRASDPGPDAGAIPWLALTARSSSGSGVFALTRHILRVRTQGGLAPSQPCTAANARQEARVPYTAVYYFYRAA
jgi:hypothetical protein